MRTRWLGSLVLLTAAGWVSAETPAPGGLKPVPEPQPVWTTGDTGGSFWNSGGSADGGKSSVWGSVDYLLWWFRDAPLPYPLVTSGTPASPNPGTLGLGGFPILTGNSVDQGAISGARLTLGGWLGSDGQFGIEASGFILPEQSKGYRAFSNSNGSPVITFRYLDPPDPMTGIAAEDAFQASLPPGNGAGAGPFSGGVVVISRTQLWGAELNGVTSLADGGGLRLQGLLGFRYADLKEAMDLQFQSNAILDGVVPFQGDTFPAPSSVSTLDTFRTRNQFYGGQFGIRAESCFGKLVVGFTGKLALGDTHEIVDVLGTSTLVPNVGPARTVPFGQFAGPSNSGRHTREDFTVLPEVEIKAGYQVTDSLRVTVGWDYLYWSRVVRPGSQFDFIVDDRTNAVNPGFVAGTTGTQFPAPLFRRTDFWAQGLTFGVELRF
jgi:hypothetical protein